MKYTKNIALFMIIYALHFPLCVQAMRGGNDGQKDAFARIQYSIAFDQKALYAKHRNLLEAIGCGENVFAHTKEKNDTSPGVHQSDKEDDSLLEDIPNQYEKNQFFAQHIPGHMSVDRTDEIEQYRKDCLALLNYARRLTLAEPAIQALSQVVFYGVGTALTLQVLGKDSMGGSIAVLNTIFNIVHSCEGMIKSGYHLVSWPDNALDDLEDYFACNKCYIPAALWPKITQSFISARQNEFSRDPHVNFIKFASGFTMYKPKLPLICKDHLLLPGVKIDLNNYIDTFFKDYHVDDIHSLDYIKLNVAKFIDVLADSYQQAPRCISLHGPGGIGKTHFVQKLSAWIDELLPHCVQFENIVIDSPQDLEGTADKPGVMLNVLRNQLLRNKRGSVIMIDEASWLNEPIMVSSAKRVFNGDQSKLSTLYFGTNMDGTGISLKIPPMLIFVTSNEDVIKDAALASRFDTVQYPMPTKEALVAYAYTIVSGSQNISYRLNETLKKSIENWVEQLSDSDKNFRYIASNVEIFVLRQSVK